MSATAILANLGGASLYRLDLILSSEDIFTRPKVTVLHLSIPSPNHDQSELASAVFFFYSSDQMRTCLKNLKYIVKS